MQKKKISRTLCKTGLNKSSECLNWLQIMTYTVDGIFFILHQMMGPYSRPNRNLKTRNSLYIYSKFIFGRYEHVVVKSNTMN